jgi:hypothetical protein
LTKEEGKPMETREKKLYRYSRAFKQKVVNDIECGQIVLGLI